MGARQSRKMDVTTTPKKDGVSATSGDASAVGDGKLERIEETDVKPTTNGIGSHTDTTATTPTTDDKDVIKDKDSVTEKENEKSTENKDEEKKEDGEVKVEETKSETPAETPVENAETATTPTEETAASPTSPDTKESKKKDKPKKKWSLRSISFSKRDKNKPVREEAAKNGDVTKEEPLAEGGEEAENAPATSPSDEKSIVASPTETEKSAPAAESKEDEKSSTIVEKNETPSSPTAPTPVPSEDKIVADTEITENKSENTVEPEPVVEKTPEVTTTEDEAPKVSAPSVPVEAPVSTVPAAPVITEDVASVTQAVEEIDINEKAVAAAVNENIEAVKTNEIIADMNHQNTLKE